MEPTSLQPWYLAWTGTTVASRVDEKGFSVAVAGKGYEHCVPAQSSGCGDAGLVFATSSRTAKALDFQSLATTTLPTSASIAGICRTASRS
jgi:hypothetical protein